MKSVPRFLRQYFKTQRSNGFSNLVWLILMNIGKMNAVEALTRSWDLDVPVGRNNCLSTFNLT